MNVAILGATGAVGREMMKILAERSFPVEELRLLASPRSAADGDVLLVPLGSRDSLRIHHAAPDPLRLLFCEWLHGISLLRPIVCAAGPDCAVSQKIPHGNGKFARFSHRKILYFQYVCVKILFCEIFMYETFRQRRKGRQV